MKQQAIDVNNLKKLTRLQLEQMIIHFKSELSQYKSKIKEYEEEYHYSQLKKLKFANVKLKNDLKENTKKLTNMEEEKISLQMKIAELEKGKTSLQIKVSELEQEVSTNKAELMQMRVSCEQELTNKKEIIAKQQKKAEKQMIMQQELEKFFVTLTEELNEPWIDHKKEKVDSEIIDKEKELFKVLNKERSNLETYQKEMQNKITELALLQRSGEGKKFLPHIEMLVQQINNYGKNIANTSLMIKQLEKELTSYKK
jgi:chromosome segregation ATPase